MGTPGSLPQAKPLTIVTDAYKVQLWAGHQESNATPAHLTQQSSTESALCLPPLRPPKAWLEATMGKERRGEVRRPELG